VIFSLRAEVQSMRLETGRGEEVAFEGGEMPSSVDASRGGKARVLAARHIAHRKDPESYRFISAGEPDNA